MGAVGSPSASIPQPGLTELASFRARVETFRSLDGFAKDLDNNYGEYTYEASPIDRDSTVILLIHKDDQDATVGAQHHAPGTDEWEINGFQTGTTIDNSTDIDIEPAEEFPDALNAAAEVAEEIKDSGSADQILVLSTGLRIIKGENSSAEDYANTIRTALNAYGRQAEKRKWRPWS